MCTHHQAEEVGILDELVAIFAQLQLNYSLQSQMLLIIIREANQSKLSLLLHLELF